MPHLPRQPREPGAVRVLVPREEVLVALVEQHPPWLLPPLFPGVRHPTAQKRDRVGDRGRPGGLVQQEVRFGLRSAGAGSRRRTNARTQTPERERATEKERERKRESVCVYVHREKKRE